MRLKHQEAFPGVLNDFDGALDWRVELGPNGLHHGLLRAIKVAGLNPDQRAIRSNAEYNGAMCCISVDHTAQALNPLALKCERPFAFPDLRFRLTDHDLDRVGQQE
jgi:hypothetical protein